MLEKYINRKDKNIYKVNLISIKNNENAYINLSKNDNICNMQGEIVEKIFIQKTMSDDYVREVITGMLIPVIREKIATSGYMPFSKNHNYLVIDSKDVINKINSPIYIRNAIVSLTNEKNYFLLEGLFKQSMVTKTEELYEYIEEHKNADAWRLELENIFKEGERRYEEAISKNLVSDNIKIAHMVKTLKKDNWV